MLGCAKAAQTEGWYGGVAAGESAVHIADRDWDDGTLVNDKLKNKGVAYKIIAGYRFTPHLDVELSYMHLADTRFTAFEPGVLSSVWQSGSVTGRAEAKGMNLEGVLAWPFKQRFALFVKGGIFMWDTTMVSAPTVSGGTLTLGDVLTAYDDGMSVIYGVGGDLRFRGDWHARLEWEHTTVRFAGIMDRGVDFPSLGVTLDF